SVMDTRPFGDRIGAVAPAMAILAARAGAELQRMQAERELRASEERFRLVSRATHAAVWEWDLASDAVRVDAQRGSEFGLPDTLCTTMDGWMTIVHPDDQERLRTMTHAALQGAAETFSAEHRVRRKDGTYVPVATRA